MQILTQKIFISSERLEEFQWNFQEGQERCGLWYYKVFSLSKKQIFGKTTRGRSQIDPPAYIGLNLKKYLSEIYARNISKCFTVC